jgi:hypothetical protein
MMIAVLGLWSSIALEQTALRRAARDARTSFQMLKQLRERTVPVSEPAAPYRAHGLQSS